jgi:diguanylate cyclase (GGDEF)-like protein
MLIFYILNACFAYAGTIYFDLQIHNGSRPIESMMKLYLVPFFVLIAILIITPFTGAMFTIDSANVYHIGFLFNFFIAIDYLYFAYILFKLILNFRKMDKHKSFSLIVCLMPLIFGVVLQSVYHDLNLILPGASLSLLFIYFNVQNRNMNTDYLTGTNNRMYSDSYISDKIKRSTSDNTFSGIMIDIDNFKEINDKYGHQAGDEALETTARLMKLSIGRKDFLARIGGDEFLIILHADSYEDLTKIVERINFNFENYNKTGRVPYKLNFSMGYDVYDYHKHMTKEQFFKHIDRLMYYSKRKKKAGNSAKPTLKL